MSETLACFCRCDELNISLGFYDATVCGGGDVGRPSNKDMRQFGQSVEAMLRGELQHHPDRVSAQGSRESPQLEGSLLDFSEKQQLPREVFHGWVVPLAAATWGIPASEVVNLSARIALRALYENGLLLPGGDKSATEAHWWPMRSRNGSADVHERARAWLARQSNVRMLYCEGSVAPSISLGTEESKPRVRVGERDLGSFDHVVMAVDPALATQILEGGSPDEEDPAWSSWVVALHGLKKLGIDVEAELHRAPPAHLRSMPNQKVAACTAVNNGVQEVSYRVRSLIQEAFGPDTRVPDEFIVVRPRSKANRHEGDEDKASLIPLVAAVLKPSSESTQAAVKTLQGQGGLWFASSLLEDGLLEGAVVSGVHIVRALLPNRAVPLDMPPWRGKLHLCFEGLTTHQRPVNASSPAAHSFRYDVRYDYVNVDAGFTAYWGGLFREDHFGDPAISLAESVRTYVSEKLGVWVTGPIDLLGSLREWGYCFNPICVFYCWESPRRERLICTVSEVTNTPWGQRSLHVLPMDDKSDKAAGGLHKRVHAREKTLHVSPFNPPPNGKASWKYSISTPSPALERLVVNVTAYSDMEQTSDTMQLAATLNLKRSDSPRQCRCIRLRSPYALLVQFKIHWQAALLWKKGLIFHGNTTCPLGATSGSISHGTLAAMGLAGAASVVAGAGGLVWGCLNLIGAV